MNNELWLIWKENKTRRRYMVGKLSYKNNEYTFKYESPELEEALEKGFDFFPGFPDRNKIYKSTELFSNIKTRLPNVQRPDYLHILNRYNLDLGSTSLDILAKTKGRLITDTYEFVRKFNKENIEFDVAGVSHSKDFESIKEKIFINDFVYLELDRENKYDIYAIKIIIVKENKRYHLGYVPRYYSKDLYHLLNEKKTYKALIKNLNLDNEIYDKDMIISIKVIFES